MGAMRALMVACLAFGIALPALAVDRAQLFPRVEAARAVVEGAREPKRVLYVFFDANCYYCHLTWKALQPYEAAGLQVRWVPVAYQKDSSAGMAAAMLLARDPAAALKQNETGYRAESYDGAVKPVGVPPDIAEALKQNMALMRALGAPGTPAIVWKSERGVEFRNAVPRLSELPRITGLPRQPVNDPELEPFR